MQIGARGLEVGLGLAGEADDDVGGQCEFSNRRPQAIHHPLVFAERVGAVHRRQHRIRRRLEREVDLRHHLAALGHRRDHAVAHVARVGRGVADALEPVDLLGRPQQIGEIVGPVMIGVHGLAQEHHFAETLRDRRPYLTYQIGERQAALAAARIGNDAVGAELVAAALDRDPRAHPRPASGLEVAVGLVAVEPGVRDRLAGRAREQLGKRPVAVGADHQVEHARLIEQLGTQMLGHASGDSDHQGRVAPLEPREVAEPPEDPLLGVLADRAGVEHHRVGVLGALGEAHAGAQEHARHHLAVGQVHLAAIGLEEHAHGGGR